MKITYNENPLLTTIELEDYEKQVLWYKIKIEQMQNKLFSAYFHLKEGKHFDVEKSRQDVDPTYYCTNDKSPIDKQTDDLLTYYVEALTEAHLGDCICFACSCDKCHAEDLLGINTILGLTKNSANKIDEAFGENNERTIEEALHYLKNYDPTPNDTTIWDIQGGYEQYMECWIKEGEIAYKWLLQYKQEYFNNL